MTCPTCHKPTPPASVHTCSPVDDCPFTYALGTESPPIVHKVIGVCAGCEDDAHVNDSGRLLCSPCAYSEANW